MDSSEAKILEAEFPLEVNDLALNSKGERDEVVTVKLETLGLISIISVFLMPLTD
jgi:hypothetical protein